MYRQNKQFATRASGGGSQLTAKQLSAFDEYLASSQNTETVSLEGAAASVQGTHIEQQSSYEVKSQGHHHGGADKVPSLMYPPKITDLDHRHHQKSDRGIVRNGAESTSFKLQPMPTSADNRRYRNSPNVAALPSTSSFSRAGGIEIDEGTIESLRQAFETFVPVCEPQSTIRGVEIRNVDPSLMKRQYLSLGLDQEQPSMYQMICQMERDAKQQGKLYLNFDEFMDFAIQFFSQRDHEKGLRYIFELFDSEKKGYITYSQFKQIFAYLGLNVSDDDMKKMFRRASSDKISIDFKDFAMIMK